MGPCPMLKSTFIWFNSWYSQSKIFPSSFLSWILNFINAVFFSLYIKTASETYLTTLLVDNRSPKSQVGMNFVITPFLKIKFSLSRKVILSRDSNAGRQANCDWNRSCISKYFPFVINKWDNNNCLWNSSEIDPYHLNVWLLFHLK